MNDKVFRQKYNKLKRDLGQLFDGQDIDYILFMTNLETGLSTLSGAEVNPMILKCNLTDCIDYIVDDNDEGGKILAFVLTNSVMEHLDHVNLAEETKKYNKFLKGDTDSLSEAEIDKFIELTRTKNDDSEFDKVIDDLTIKYNINDDLKYSLLDLLHRNYKYYLNMHRSTGEYDKDKHLEDTSRVLNNIYAHGWIDDFSKDYVDKISLLIASNEE